MNIVTLMRKSDGRKFQGFLDWIPNTRNVNFYYYDERCEVWTSTDIGDFKPIPEKSGIVLETKQDGENETIEVV